MRPNFRPFARLFKALAEDNRLRIIHVIAEGEMTVSQVVEATGLSQPLASHHLRALREAGIVRSRRDGPFIRHALADPNVLERLEAWSDVVGNVRARALEQHQELDLPRWVPRPDRDHVPARRHRRRGSGRA